MLTPSSYKVKKKFEHFLLASKTWTRAARKKFMELYESQTVVIFCWLNAPFSSRRKIEITRWKRAPSLFINVLNIRCTVSWKIQQGFFFSRSLVDEENPLFTPALHQSDLRKLFLALAYSLCFSEALNSFSSNLMLEWWNWLIRRHHQAPNSSRNKSKSFFLFITLHFSHEVFTLMFSIK